jgi:hypothetical protein
MIFKLFQSLPKPKNPKDYRDKLGRKSIKFHPSKPVTKLKTRRRNHKTFENKTQTSAPLF